MEPIQYNPTQSNTGFDPVAPIDPTDALATEHEKALANEREILRQIQGDAAVIRANNAERIEGIKGLADFSSKAADELADLYVQDAIDQRKDAFTKELLDPSPPSPDYVAGRKEAESQFVDGQKVAAEVGKIDYEAAEPFRSGSVWAQMGRKEAQALLAIENELPRIIEEATKQFVELPPSEREPLINAIIADFAESKGLTGMRRSFLEDKILPEIRQVKSADFREYKIAYNKRETARQLAELEQSIASRTPDTIIPQLAAIAGEDGRPMGYTAALDKFEQLVANGVVLETISPEQYKAMGDKVIPKGNPGAGQRYRDFYRTRFARINAAIDAGIVQADRAEQGVKQIENRELGEALIKSLREDPEGFNKDTWERAMQTYADATNGKTYDALKELESETFEKLADEEATLKLRDLRREGLLSVALLKGMNVSNDVYEEFIGDAQKQDEARGKDLDGPQWIRDLVQTGGDRGSIAATPDGRRDPTVGIAEDALTRYYNRSLAGYLEQVDDNNSVADAKAKAEKATREYFDTSSEFKITSDGYQYFDPINNGQETADRAAVVRRQKYIEENARRVEDYLLKGEKDIKGQAAFKKSELEAIARKYGTVNFVMPEKAKTLARIKGITPFQVLQIQMRANDLPELPESPAVKVFQDTITPAQQRLFNRNPTPAASVRVLGSAGKFSPEIVPKGLGPVIQEAATKYNIPPAILAGILEAESGFLDDVITGKRLSKSGAIGIAQFLPGTASDRGVDPLNTTSAIHGAAKYLRDIMDGNVGNGIAYSRKVPLETAIYMYNAGPNYRDLSVYPYGEENRNYLPKVMRAAYKYGYKEALDVALVRPAFQ